MQNPRGLGAGAAKALPEPPGWTGPRGPPTGLPAARRRGMGLAQNRGVTVARRVSNPPSEAAAPQGSPGWLFRDPAA